MHPFRLIINALVMATLLASQAFALEIDNTTDTAANGSAKFDDPDDNIPVAHLDDGGQMTQPNGSVQMQLYGNGNNTAFGPAGRNGDDAFTRAQERQMQ
ncbi:MAG: hypothetical protein KGI29_00390 [Pseudomonadota bacterium]|nr:hypothetical protein [Pseudomonadota bacterium]MDE3038071.1 hypothetical protein [Pseudomonadota bacterium]